MRTATNLLLASLFATVACNTVTAQNPAKGSKNIVEVAQAAGSFNTLIAAAKAADLVPVLTGKGPYTVFAPTDDAFEKLPEGTVQALLMPENKAQLATILKYHVVPGKIPSKALKPSQFAGTAAGQSLLVTVSDKGVMVDKSAKVVKADIMASNGIIHVVDSVIMPPKNIVQTAASTGTFKTLLAAATAAGLAPTLSKDGPFTVFAPTDAAFAKLPEGTVANLLKDENKDQLVAILKLHVIKGRVLSTDIPMSKEGKPSVEPKTLNGEALRIIADKKGVTVSGAKVVSADVLAANGVIHVVDTVILPSSN